MVFLWLLRVVPSVSHPLRRLLPGALFGAAGFEVLKLIGGYYLSLIDGSVTASAFGGAVGLLIWINLVARFAFFTAAWTATLRSIETPASSSGGASDAAGAAGAVTGRVARRRASRPAARTTTSPAATSTGIGRSAPLPAWDTAVHVARGQVRSG